MTKKRAVDLTPGDVVPIPPRERAWLRRRPDLRTMTVTGVAVAAAVGRVPWLEVSARYPNPYGRGERLAVFRMRPGTVLTVV